jgi:hypothetical protein
MSGRLLSVFQVLYEQDKKWRSKLHVAVFFFEGNYTGCSQVFSIDRYKLRDNRIPRSKQNQKLTFIFEKCAIQIKGSKSTSRCVSYYGGIISNFISVYHWQSFPNRHKIITTSLFFFPKKLKNVAADAFVFRVAVVSLFVCVRTSVDRHRAASPSCTWLPSLISLPVSYWSIGLCPSTTLR